MRPSSSSDEIASARISRSVKSLNFFNISRRPHALRPAALHKSNRKVIPSYLECSGLAALSSGQLHLCLQQQTRQPTPTCTPTVRALYTFASENIDFAVSCPASKLAWIEAMCVNQR